MKYLDIVKGNKSFEKKFQNLDFNISIIGNLTFNKIKDILEFELRRNDIPANIILGNYDSVIQDSQAHQNSKAVVIHQELGNMSSILRSNPALEKIKTEEIINQVKIQIDLYLDNLKGTPLVIHNYFSSLPFSQNSLETNSLDIIAKELNGYLDERSKHYTNLRLVNIEKVISLLGVSAFDFKSFYSFKDLYSFNWYLHYTEQIKHLIFSISGKIKKAIIFDCDNTLWKGIVGEDGYDKIEMNENTKNGEIFKEIQTLANSLTHKGILLCLCSKNNFIDVQEVIEKHPDFQIKDKDITVKKVNWNDKATNIQEISKELNIGLDSLVFIDDSDFEINLVKERLPEVLTFQVPKNLSDYPSLFRRIMSFFHRNKITTEDLKKVEEYKIQGKRSEIKSKSNNINDYIKSLDIKVKVYKDSQEHLTRMEQMAQKTNQFNFTTIRHTESEIKKFIADESYHTYCIKVQDKFGDSGITGLIIIRKDHSKNEAEIITFLMSCRVIGRNIEYKFLNEVINDLKEQNIQTLLSSYKPTKKNPMVQSFFKDLGFEVINTDDDHVQYKKTIDQIMLKNINTIGVIDD